MNTDVLIASTACVATGLLYLTFLKRAIYNALDPLLLSTISVAFSAALLTFLCSNGLIYWDKLRLFSLVFLAYLIGAWFSLSFFGRETFRTALIRALSAIRRSEITIVLSVTIAITLLLCVLGIAHGATGDARQAFGRTFRPLIVLHSGLTDLALLLLLSPKLSTKKALAWLIPLIALSIPFSGKSVLAPLIYWFGLRMFVERTPLTLGKITAVLAFGAAGAGGMIFLAYHVSQFSNAFAYLGRRLWLSGDVYIIAYQNGGLDWVRGNYPVSFLPYVLHPFTSIVGIRAYSRPLGAMLASSIAHNDVLTGPNPQLPVLLDFFFPDHLVQSAFISFAVGAICMAIRPLGVALATKQRSRFLAVAGLAAAVFCPAAGFTDFSLVSITAIGIMAAACIFVPVELALATPNSSSLHAHTT